jgi:hypothetical protein
MDKNVYYIKAKLQKTWPELQEGFDWEMLKEGSTDLTKSANNAEIALLDHEKYEYMVEMKKGDIIVCHSDTIKVGENVEKVPRIVALGLVSKSRHFEDDVHKTVIRKVVELPRAILTENLPMLKDAEPFMKNDFVTKLTEKEYEKLLYTILKKDPSVKDRLSALER